MPTDAAMITHSETDNQRPGPVVSPGSWEASPFTNGTLLGIRFANSQSLTIHKAILEKWPELSARVAAGKLDLSQFSVTAGHALVNYLYIKKYRPLKWKGPPKSFTILDSREAQELRLRLETYALTRTVNLKGLEDLVKKDIEEYATKFDMFTVMDIVRETYPVPIGDDMWFHPWIKSLIKNDLRRPEKLVQLARSQDLSDEIGALKFIVGCLTETVVSELGSLTRDGKKEASSESGDTSEATRADDNTTVVYTPAGSEPDSVSATVVHRPPAHESQSVTQEGLIPSLVPWAFHTWLRIPGAEKKVAQDEPMPVPEPEPFDFGYGTKKSNKKKRAMAALEQEPECFPKTIDDPTAPEADEAVPAESEISFSVDVDGVWVKKRDGKWGFEKRR
ncbi:uncharacterized protein C8A04DRAFT_30175 [Dichotomopilus funicola]|uniref:BTB domain-containing protein n=1 Tax=Dichotomopilus funicola TaxID=1934379 RepID=A0AAN6V293_9PEZI|nr:hypothetical protein C8A04DRAFT_30175 [Dichotomopilus funicola]